MKPLILIGGGGHCRSAIDVIESEGFFSITGITDTIEKVGETISGVEIIAEDNKLGKLIPKYRNCLVTVGHLKNPGLRIKLYQLAKDLGAKFPVISSPTAHVSKKANIEAGTIIFHKAVVNAAATIGADCIINTGAIIEHDVTIGDHTHISTGSIINGHCSVGSRSLIGSGTVVIQEITIGDDIVVGANSTVIKDLTEPGVYVGSPAQKIIG
jgi:sugar O-acyltransferase (sialic acid O-acetyltransferase NeuD family)